MHMHAGVMETGRAIRSPGSVVTGGCELPDRGSGPLQEQNDY